MMLLKIENLMEGQIVKRPSKHIKSPYVADVKFGETEILGHAPALGCCGLSDTNATILMTPSKTDTKCSHTICLSIHEDQVIGIHPKFAEKLVENALTKNCFSTLQDIKSFRRETKVHIPDYVDSRFDFSGVDKDGTQFLMEVKNVPLANIEGGVKTAYFPDGYRKSPKTPVSPRALKHIRELTLLRRGVVHLDKENPQKIRCIMCYVIQRTDATQFKASDKDPEYKQALKDAIEAGVEVITLVVEWNKNGEAYFVRDDLPVL